MNITSNPKTRVVKNLVFLFTSGTVLDIDLVESEGDSMEWDTFKEAYIVTIEARTGSDISFGHPKETITIFKDKIISISHSEREEMEKTAEQELLLKQTIQEMGSKSIN